MAVSPTTPDTDRDAARDMDVDATTACAVADAEAATPRFRACSGRLCLDFLRTLRYRGRPDPVEELPDAEALSAWVAQCGPTGLTGQPVLVGPAQVRDAHRLREAVQELIAAGRGPGGVSSSSFLARELVNRAARNPAPTPRVDASGRLSWTAVDAVAATMSLVARDAIDLVTSPALERVRECADESCSALFRDNSRPGNRRWCSMGACGNKAKKSGIRSRATGC